MKMRQSCLGETLDVPSEAVLASDAASVILVFNYSPDRQESMLRFGNALLSELRASGVNVRSWEPPRLLGRWAGAGRGGLAKWLGYVDKFVLGSLSLLICRARHPMAVWHIIDHSNALYCFLLPTERTVVTCHDCIAIEEARIGRTGEKVGRFGPFFQALITKGLRKCENVACVSAATAADLERIVGINRDRSLVIHNGLLVAYRRVECGVARRRLEEAGVPTDEPFIFMVGSNLIRKNRIGTIAIFEALRDLAPERRYRLVLAGKPWSAEVKRAAMSCRYGNDIVETGRLSDQVLEAAYSAAAVVIFPSLAEGFGLPVIEAQACGAPVVASDIPPMPEVGGSGALYADPRRPTDFARAIQRAMGLGSELREQALENTKRFETRKWAAQYRSLYASLVVKRTA